MPSSRTHSISVRILHEIFTGDEECSPSSDQVVGSGRAEISEGLNGEKKKTIVGLPQRERSKLSIIGPRTLSCYFASGI